MKMREATSPQEAKRRELVSFRLGAQEFCVDIMAVREIRGWTDVTPLPHAPAYVRGMINLRGIVLPIIDMGARLGLPVDDLAKRRVIIVVSIGTKLVGLLVDAVCDILAVPDDSLHAAPELAGETIPSFVTAVLTVEERMICLISLSQLLPELDAVAA
jgi:purine-binding chemotaxis protein CheW